LAAHARCLRAKSDHTPVEMASAEQLANYLLPDI
jgi:hypothetical protein